jgi:serine-type D-Ala-D-Ala carboxypeptidase/endopeptidase (penicillin-binding protein 4)
MNVRLGHWHTLFLLAGIGLLSLAGPGDATAESLPPPVVKALKQQRMSQHSISLYVHEIGQPLPLLSHRAETARNPASTIKLLTTLVALERLGPAYQWRTEVYGDQPVRQGRLSGNIILKGYGDPSLTIERFWLLVRALRDTGLSAIGEDLVVDQSYFDVPPEDPGEFDARPDRAYNVAPRALLVNFQANAFRFIPQDGGLAIATVPRMETVTVENRVQLTGRPCRGWASELGMRVTHNPLTSRVLFSGRYASDCGERVLFRSIVDATRYIHGVFKSLWQEQGGTLNGNAREGKVGSKARLLYVHHSPPLAEVVRSINKYSNNVMSRLLLLTLGAESNPPGTVTKGIAVIHAWLEQNGFQFPELVIDNGAGLSRDTRISAAHLGALLRRAYHSPYMPEFIASLPVPSLDGTLQKRFTNQAFAGRSHLKTGSLEGVRTMAGIVHDRRGRRLVAVCLQNHPRAHTRAGEAVQEALLAWLDTRP